MRCGRRHGCRQDAAHLRQGLQQEGLPNAAAQHARAHRLGHRSVPHLQGGEKTKQTNIYFLSSSFNLSCDTASCPSALISQPSDTGQTPDQSQDRDFEIWNLMRRIDNAGDVAVNW